MKKMLTAAALAVAVGLGATACTGSAYQTLPNGTVVSKGSNHDQSGSHYWLQVRYSTTGNGKNIAVNTYRVSQRTYNNCQPGWPTSSCR